MKEEKGITLVALIITIIVLLILAVVTISAVNEGGLFSYVNNAVRAYDKSAIDENTRILNYLTEFIKYDKNISSEESELASTSLTTSYVGYYANLDSDPEPEGIIYVDLLYGTSISGQFSDYSDGEFSFNSIENAKDYYISEELYKDGPFGDNYILTPNGDGNERFYIMALSDYDSNKYTFYQENELLNGNNEWYIPSKEQWSAFAVNLNIKTSNYIDLGVQNHYWTSTERTNDRAFFANLYDEFIDREGKGGEKYIRFGTTF